MLDEINDIKKNLQEYIEVRLDLLRLHLAENISRIISNTVTMVIFGYLLFFMLLFMSLAAGFFISGILHSDTLGFLCVAGFYFFVLIIFSFLRRQIVEQPVIKAILKLFFPKINDDENK